MNLIHQGIDIVDVTKFRDVICRHASFVADIFTADERQYCLSRRDPYLQFAAFFAAKESYLKALGTGFRGPGIDHVFRDVEITLRAPGTYEVVVAGWARRMSALKKVQRSIITISYEPGYAVAWAVLLSAEMIRQESKCATC